MSQTAVDYNTIHKHLKQLKFSQNSSNQGSPTQLDEPTAIKYVSILSQDLVNLISSSPMASTSQLNPKTLNEILVLTKTLDYVPKSDKLFSLFDAQLFRALIGLASISDIPVEVLRGVLRICLTYLAGVLPKTRKQGMFRVLLGVLCEPVNPSSNEQNNSNATTTSNKKFSPPELRCDLLFANLTSKITFADARMNLNIVDFVAKVFYRLMETISLIAIDDENAPLIAEEQWLFSVVRSLFVTNFFGVLSCIKGIEEIEGMTGLRGSMELTSKWLQSRRVKWENPIWLECCALIKEVGVTLSEYKLSIINDSVIPKSASDGAQTISLGGGILSVFCLVGALKQPKRSLKKVLVECNMTSAFPIIKFVTTISPVISQRKSLTRIFGIWNTELWYNLMNVALRCWLFSGATTEADDIDKVINMVAVVVVWLSKKLDNGKEYKNNKNNDVGNITKDDIEINDGNNDYDVVSLLEKVDNFDYDELKALQLEELRLNRSKLWENEMKPFEYLVHNQVVALVRDQRFLQLSKGSWVYATNPLDSGENRHYFLTLNSNSQSIVYKEFAKRPPRHSQAPNLDKDGIYIEFKNIVGIESENLNPTVNETGLISIQSERMDVNKVEVITKNKIFQFYVDTKQLKDIWVDGLRILVSDSRSDPKEKEKDNLTNNDQIKNAAMNHSNSEEFFAGSGVSDDVKEQVRKLEDVRIRTQMLDLEEESKPAGNSNIDSYDWSSLSTNFHYE